MHKNKKINNIKSIKKNLTYSHISSSYKKSSLNFWIVYQKKKWNKTFQGIKLAKTEKIFEFA